MPFCASKCPYCDFYSLRGTPEDFDRYALACGARISEELSRRDLMIDTLYFGGGTPSVIGAERLAGLLDAAGKHLTADCEITAECNPSGVDLDFFRELFSAGFNRISMGMQSAVDSERRALGRLADAQKVARAVASAKEAGFENISLDLMLGVPGQTAESLDRSLNFCLDCGIKHISMYILKIEEGTVFYKRKNALDLPDEDAQCDLYLQAFDRLEKGGFRQYEISNAAIPGFESRHNLKYWNGEEYLGLGPAAHSFMDGKRFFFPRDTEYFINGGTPIDDGEGGGFEEYAMLRLRLTEGLTETGVRERFGFSIPGKMRAAAEKFQGTGLAVVDGEGIRLTRQGFLLSNRIIGELLNCESI